MKEFVEKVDDFLDDNKLIIRGVLTGAFLVSLHSFLSLRNFVRVPLPSLKLLIIFVVVEK